MELQKRPVVEVERIQSSSQSGERPKYVATTTQTVEQCTPTTEPDESALLCPTEAEVSAQGYVRPTTDEEGPVHASWIAQ